MTVQQPQTPQFSIAELGAKFGEQLAQLYAQIITLEKQIKILENSLDQGGAELPDWKPHQGTMSREAAGIAEEGRMAIREYEKSRPD